MLRCLLLVAAVSVWPPSNDRARGAAFDAAANDETSLTIVPASDGTKPAIAPSESPAAAPPAADRIFLISTRGVGTRCDGELMNERLQCEQLINGERGGGRWQKVEFSKFTQEFADPLPTVFYVHGNRVERGEDKRHGLAVYRSIASRKQGDGALRYVIWSWPADQIRGQVRDYQVKAARTGPVGWQLAWAIDQLPEQSPISLVGYSYGARVVTGALHLLAGGEMGKLRLDVRLHPQRRMRAALVAAAVDADWLRPAGYHGRALEQVDELLLVNNQLDPAMRFYHLPLGDRHARALGYSGIPGSRNLGELGAKVRSVDASNLVGRHHGLTEYLSASTRLGRVWEQVVPAPAIDVPVDIPIDAAVAERKTMGDLQ